MLKYFYKKPSSIFLILLFITILFSAAVALSCTTDLDCPPAAYCENSTSFLCEPKKPIGSYCNESRECLSGICSNSVCVENAQVPLKEWWECRSSGDVCERQEIVTGGEVLPVGCKSDSMCKSGYYCYLPKYICIGCPVADSTFNGLNLSRDFFCPSSACIGYDLDCCLNDSYCPAGSYCQKTTATCIECREGRDFFCPSSACIGYDLDCCLNDSYCPAGSYCLNGSCIPKLGTACNSSADCPDGTECAQYICVLKNFATFVQDAVTIYGPSGKTELLVRDPTGRGSIITIEGVETNRFLVLDSPEDTIYVAPNQAYNVSLEVICPYSEEKVSYTTVVRVVEEKLGLTSTAELKIDCIPQKETEEPIPAPTGSVLLYISLLFFVFLLKFLF